jgi:hypothetical protein
MKRQYRNLAFNFSSQITDVQEALFQVIANVLKVYEIALIAIQQHDFFVFFMICRGRAIAKPINGLKRWVSLSLYPSYPLIRNMFGKFLSRTEITPILNLKLGRYASRTLKRYVCIDLQEGT